MSSSADEILEELLEGNRRFRAGQGSHFQYPPAAIAELGKGKPPRAAIVACSDGRVTPETIFDQPLTRLFVSRVPGNVASDSAKWMLEIAVNDLEVPLVIVMGHTECLAIKQVIDGRASAGGSLRHEVHRAVAEARQKGGDNLFERAVEENALQTARLLREESFAVRQAIADRRVKLVCSVYDVHSGEVRMLNDRM